eukprot:GDKJ01013899.1.p1 GENE.GDKJ01013899.1~~GDKJ01013899.1.p1  ORF type:complete len:479 (-),score=82.66 GDKJ01013899.1:101-1336(-)
MKIVSRSGVTSLWWGSKANVISGASSGFIRIVAEQTLFKPLFFGGSAFSMFEKSSFTRNCAMQFGCISVALALLYPLDVIHTRQASSLDKNEYRSFWKTLSVEVDPSASKQKQCMQLLRSMYRGSSLAFFSLVPFIFVSNLSLQFLRATTTFDERLSRTYTSIEANMRRAITFGRTLPNRFHFSQQQTSEKNEQQTGVEGKQETGNANGETETTAETKTSFLPSLRALGLHFHSPSDSPSPPTGLRTLAEEAIQSDSMLSSSFSPVSTHKDDQQEPASAILDRVSSDRDSQMGVAIRASLLGVLSGLVGQLSVYPLDTIRRRFIIHTGRYPQFKYELDHGLKGLRNEQGPLPQLECEQFHVRKVTEELRCVTDAKQLRHLYKGFGVSLIRVVPEIGTVCLLYAFFSRFLVI